MLKAVVSKSDFEALSPVEQGHYTATEGAETHRLAVEAVNGVELADTVGLKRSLQSERDLRSRAETALKPYDGLDPVAARDALGKMDEISKWDPEEKLAEGKTQYEKQVRAQADAQLGKLNEEHVVALGLLTDRNGTLTSQLTSTLIDAVATQAITEAKGSIDLLKPVIQSKVRTKVGDDGILVVEVIDDDNLTRLSPVSGNTDPMTIGELVNELRNSDRYARAFDGTGASGAGGAGGAGSQGRGGSGGNVIRLTRAQSLDTPTYRQALAESKKTGKKIEFVDDPA